MATEQEKEGVATEEQKDVSNHTGVRLVVGFGDGSRKRVRTVVDRCEGSSLPRSEGWR